MSGGDHCEHPVGESCIPPPSQRNALPHTLVYLSCGWEALGSEVDLITGRRMKEDSEQQGILNKSNTTLGSMPASSLGSAISSAAPDAHDEDTGWRLSHAVPVLPRDWQYRDALCLRQIRGEQLNDLVSITDLSVARWLMNIM